MVDAFHKRLHDLLPPIQKISQSYIEKGVPSFCKGNACKLAPYIRRALQEQLHKGRRERSSPRSSDTDLSPIGQEMMRQARNKSRRGGRPRRGGGRWGVRHRKKKRRTRTRRRRRKM